MPMQGSCCLPRRRQMSGPPDAPTQQGTSLQGAPGPAWASSTFHARCAAEESGGAPGLALHAQEGDGLSAGGAGGPSGADTTL